MKKKHPSEAFKVYVDRLLHGEVEHIEETVPPDFMEMDADDEAQFATPVHFVGEAYLAEGTLLLHLEVTTEVSLPCAICNQAVALPLYVPKFYHTVPLADIKGAIFYIDAVLREAILLELPHFPECGGGKCPERESLKPFLSPSKGIATKEEKYYPFKDL
ncbi:MAG: hypothetical protein KDK65_05785 [Chlamydiia bacterium]|nr:hypothetical protein [Chlamydiia bacterium]